MDFRPTGFNVLPPVIKNLLILNGLFFLATIVVEIQFRINLAELLGLHYFFSEDFRPHQIITYMFMHGGFAHLFFNMFALWMFGNVLENVWGGKRFLIYYLVCGVGAVVSHYTVHYFEIKPIIAALHDYLIDPSREKFDLMLQAGYLSETIISQNILLVEQYNNTQQAFAYSGGDQAIQQSIDFVMSYEREFLNAPVVVGASGSVFGILLAFGMMFPNTMVYFMLFFPMKAKYFVILYGLVELYAAFNPSSGDNIAHYAHLGGMLFGFILIKYWQRNHPHYY